MRSRYQHPKMTAQKNIFEFGAISLTQSLISCQKHIDQGDYAALHTMQPEQIKAFSNQKKPAKTSFTPTARGYLNTARVNQPQHYPSHPS